VLDGVCIVWAGRLEKLLEVINKLLCLALEVTLGSDDVFFIKVISLLVVVTFIAASSNCDLLWSLLIAFGASLRSFTGSLGRCPSAASGAHLPIALDENSPDCLLTRAVSGGDVKKLLCGLRLITTESMHKGSTISAKPKYRDDVGIVDLGEFVAHQGDCQM
jgi:hypothetical protein